MTKIVKATSKGQITIPAVWRKKFNTDQFLINYDKNKLIIEPIKIFNEEDDKIELKKAIKEEKKKSDLLILDAERDNKGKGIKIDKFIKILKEVDG
jgi:AbrB family looped-hinge helix DNA binding protein